MPQPESAKVSRTTRGLRAPVTAVAGIGVFIAAHVVGADLSDRWPRLDTVSYIAVALVAMVIGGAASLPRYAGHPLASSGRWGALAALLFIAGSFMPLLHWSGAADVALASWLLAALCAWRAYRVGRAVPSIRVPDV